MSQGSQKEQCALGAEITASASWSRAAGAFLELRSALSSLESANSSHSRALVDDFPLLLLRHVGDGGSGFTMRVRALVLTT